MPNQTVKNDLNRSNWLKWLFSWKAINKIFMYLWAPFIVQNLKSIFRANLEFLGCVIFGSKMTHLPWTNLFWHKPLLLPSSTYRHFSVRKSLKRLLALDPELWGCIISWTINGLFATLTIFFRKPVNNLSSIHSCLSTCQISNSNDDLLKKYWWLKNIEISLAKRHFWL